MTRLLTIARIGCYWLFAGMLSLAGCSQQEEKGEIAQGSLARVRLITAEQYSNVISHVFGADVADAVIAPIPPMQRVDGLLASGAASIGLTSGQVSQIQQAAAKIAAIVVDEDHRNFLMPCIPEVEDQPDDDCAEAFLADSGRLLFRRPLSSEQLARLTAIADQAAKQTDNFYDGLALAIEAMLISPDFLFIADRTLPGAETDSLQRLEPYSLASRLSFFLWNGPPDDALLKAAAAGRLNDPEGLTAEIDRMLASGRLQQGVRTFFDDMLAFDDFDSLAKDAHVYPAVTGRTLADAREQTLRTVVDHLLARERDYRDLFTTRDTFMSPSLAVVYGTPAQDGWAAHEFAEGSQRMGLLTHVSFLAANSHSVRSSPTLRGKALRELMLCQHVPEPPPNVDFSKIEDAGEVATARERLKVHNTNPSCAGCHLITDPMGLSLEQFDGSGAYRETENGAEIDIRGELDGVFYDDVPGLANAMRNHPKLSYCLVNRLYAYGTGGPVSLKYDRDTLKGFENRFAMNDYRFKALLRDLTTSSAFTHVRRDPVSTVPAKGMPGNEAVSENSPAQGHTATVPVR